MPNDTCQITFSGVGGQGLVLDGYLLGEAVSIHESRHATMMMTYGAESRGTFTKADVVISDKPIDYIEVVDPDYVVSLAQVAYERYNKLLGPDAVLIYDSDEVTPGDCTGRQMGFPIRSLAIASGGLLSANLVSMGILVTLSKIVKPDSIIQALKSRFEAKPEIAEKNIRAFHEGIGAAR